MATDMKIWRTNVFDEVDSIADEDHQRTSWFGIGPFINSPGEQFCAFFDNARVPEFLADADNGLDGRQTMQLARLSDMMRRMSDDTPDFIKPEDLIDDPRWEAIRQQAKITLDVLTKDV